MNNFAKILLDEFATRQRVFKLLRNDKSLIDNFLAEIKNDKNLEPELGELYGIIENAADGLQLPINKYRALKVAKNLKYKPFEAKSKHLRIYLFQERETGMIIIIGGKKVEQPNDIKRVEQIIKDYTLFKSNT